MKDAYINRQIEYDQRFFNNGYESFHLMISDVRKQLKLNEEILRMKETIKKIKTAPSENHECKK